MAILDEPQNPLSESEVSMQPVIIKWGLISAIVGIIFQVLTNILGASTLTFILSGVSLVIGLFILTLAVREDRDGQLGGYATFKRVFLLVLIIMLFSSIITQVFNFVYMNYLNPSAIDAALDAARSMLEKFNMSEEQIDTALEQTAKDLKSPMNIVKSMIGVSIFGSIVALIYAAIMKKERPLFN